MFQFRFSFKISLESEESILAYISETPFDDPYDPYRPLYARQMRPIRTEEIEVALLNPKSRHYPIYKTFLDNKDTLKLFFEIMPEKELSVIEIIEQDPYYRSCVYQRYKNVSALTPISRWDMLVLAMEIAYNDFKDVIGLSADEV